MSTGRSASLFVLASVFLGACANAEDTGFTLGYDAGGKADSASIDTGSAEEDTGSPVVDTGTKKDTGVVVEDTGTTPVDSSTTDSATVDSSTGDTALTDVTDSVVVTDTATTDTDSGDTDSGTVTGTLLASGTVSLQGITSDNYVVYADSAGTVYAVPLTGGTAQTVGTGVARVLVSNKAVFVWGTTDGYGFGTLRVWTAANGTKSIGTKSLAPSTSASYAFYTAVSSTDGTWAMFTDGGVGGVSDRADIKIIKTDGTGLKTIFTQYFVYDGTSTSYADNCAPLMGYVGTRFITSHCTPGTTASFDASSVDPTVGTATSLGTGLGAYWSADDAGSKVALVTSAGSLRLVPMAGGTATIIDSGVANAMFTHDGTYVVYRTSANALKRSPTSSASPSTLIASGVATILSGVSGNDKFMLYSSGTTAGAYDIRLASTSTAGTGTVLYGSSLGEVYGDAFTADSAYALWFQSVASDVGTLTTAPTTGGSSFSLGTSTWLNWSGLGSKVVWNDGYSATTTKATIRSRDLASLTGTITTIAANADRTFLVTPAKDKIVYTMSGGSADGLYAAAVP